jgi:hypothetical protein
VLRRIFRPRRDEVTGDRRELRNEELHNLDTSPSIISMVKSRKIRWARNIARMRENIEYKYISVISGKAKRMETTKKTKT